MTELDGAHTPGEIDELVLPFTAHGIDGRILVDSASNHDPELIDDAFLADGYGAEACLGFPVVTAHIDYDGKGYRQLFGWIQVVTHIFSDSRRDPYCEIDQAEIAESGGPPFFPYGYLPMYHAAPVHPDHPDARWLAETFLTYPAGEHEVQAVAGFSWGYDLSSGRPDRLPLAPLTAERWNAHLALLSKSSQLWNFRSGFGEGG